MEATPRTVDRVSRVCLVLASVLSLGSAAKATTITFAIDPPPANNSDLPPDLGTNAAADGSGFTTSDGTGPTPDIGLTWAPAGGLAGDGSDIDVLELHSSITFIGAGFEVPILQFDMDLSNHSAPPVDPTIDFTVTGGFSLQLHSLEIGNATDQVEAPYRWIISVIRLSDLVTVQTKTTGFMTAGNRETVVFDFTGAPNESYRLHFDDEGADRVRTGIDNLSFSQVLQTNVDTDGDGMLDSYENANGLDRLVNDAALDKDGDGLSNLAESQRGTRANNPDTDGDGLTDGAETNTGVYVSATNTGTNPFATDTDGDGYKDGAEVAAGVDPTKAAITPEGRSNIRTAVEFEFYSAQGASYRIESSTNLVDWTVVEQNITGTGDIIRRLYSTREPPTRVLRAVQN